MADAPGAIGNEEEPVRAVRYKEDASIVRAARAVAAGEADGLVSAGSTGAALAASVAAREAHPRRPPSRGRRAAPGSRPRHPAARRRRQQRGAPRASGPVRLHGVRLHGVGPRRRAAQRVGLLSNGQEAGKGTPDVKEANERLTAAATDADGGAGALNFVGNVEGSDLTGGELDVVVTDGFTGNVALKAIEGTSRTVVARDP